MVEVEHCKLQAGVSPLSSNNNRRSRKQQRQAHLFLPDQLANQDCLSKLLDPVVLAQHLQDLVFLHRPQTSRTSLPVKLHHPQSAKDLRLLVAESLASALDELAYLRRLRLGHLLPMANLHLRDLVSQAMLDRLLQQHQAPTPLKF